MSVYYDAGLMRRYIPDMIKGDLDSLRSDVSSFYASKGVSIKHDSDQYSTDLMKCISEVENIEKASGRKVGRSSLQRADAAVLAGVLWRSLWPSGPNSTYHVDPP